MAYLRAKYTGGRQRIPRSGPSDPQDELLPIGTSNGSTPGGSILWYNANVGGVTDSRSAWTDDLQAALIDGDGMLMNVKAIRIAEVADGTSNTLFVGEVTGAGPGATAAGV